MVLKESFKKLMLAVHLPLYFICWFHCMFPICTLKHGNLFFATCVFSRKWLRKTKILISCTFPNLSFGMKSLKSGKSWAFLTSVTLHSHLQVMCSAVKESSRKLILQYMWQHILTCKLCVVLRKGPLKNICCSTCDIKFSLASCV